MILVYPKLIGQSPKIPETSEVHKRLSWLPNQYKSINHHAQVDIELYIYSMDSHCPSKQCFKKLPPTTQQSCAQSCQTIALAFSASFHGRKHISFAVGAQMIVLLINTCNRDHYNANTERWPVLHQPPQTTSEHAATLSSPPTRGARQSGRGGLRGPWTPLDDHALAKY